MGTSAPVKKVHKIPVEPPEKIPMHEVYEPKREVERVPAAVPTRK